MEEVSILGCVVALSAESVGPVSVAPSVVASEVACVLSSVETSGDIVTSLDPSAGVVELVSAVASVDASVEISVVGPVESSAGTVLGYVTSSTEPLVKASELDSVEPSTGDGLDAVLLAVGVENRASVEPGSDVSSTGIGVAVVPSVGAELASVTPSLKASVEISGTDSVVP